MNQAQTPWHLRCVRCQAQYDGMEVRYRCGCGGTLDVIHDLEALRGQVSREGWDARMGSRTPWERSGVWRFRELILPLDPEYIVTRPEGNTNLYDAPQVASYVGADQVRLKHEGENPSGSFKDRGMTAGISMARRLGMTRVAVASTGNTSASVASYAAAAGMQAYVFIPEGKIAYGKLCQALAYGARTLQLEGDFDDAMRLVQEVCDKEGIYLLNSVNPFRIEGQKAIGFEILQDLNWEVPDWIVLPGGNLGNNTALSKGMAELLELGIIDKLPRIAVIQAEGASPLYQAMRSDGVLRPVKAQTLASAIRIGDPVSFDKSVRGLRQTQGVVESVTDAEIMDAKAIVDRSGIGAEPASCATVAGLRKLIATGVIAPDASICGVLTGNLLKDPAVTVQYHTHSLEGHSPAFANAPVKVSGELEDILKALA